MIISASIKPNQTLYYFGAKLIGHLKHEPSSIVDSLHLFEQFQRILGIKITFTQYMYTLDWLYLLNMIDINDEGDIIVCF
ncbi:hypothetical protein D1731_09280 [Salmonella enterica subsp. enterica serovar Luke]|nr:hypothetical protein [Salmonella enterica subsp. enterica serovar Luke]EEA8599541.1 hypothetical protein [Salmonella enterica subsp. enterica]HAF1383561.1 hypothetical protein [Salmonella enterica]EBH8710444.1 hypothetical protein [Salmonella enterica subsp. enterica serovar Luke]EDW0769243.1 hypothetical protein [Salmonella enterica subsp. enterica serovar Luke]